MTFDDLDRATRTDSLGQRFAKLSKKVAWEAVGRPAEERRAACTARIDELSIQSQIAPRSDSLDHPPEPIAPEVPPGVRPRYTTAGAIDAWSAGSGLRGAMQPGRGGIADWNQKKRERENSRANQNSFELQKHQQEFAEAQALYDREFVVYERDVVAYEKYLAGDETWRFQVGLAAAQREVGRIIAVRDALLVALAEEVQLRPREDRHAAEHRAGRVQQQLRDSKAPAAWVNDPASERRYRYWDGKILTEHFAPKSSPIPSIKEVVDSWGVGHGPGIPAPRDQDPTHPPQAAGIQSKTAQLKDLLELRNAGVLNDEEFEQLKSEII